MVPYHLVSISHSITRDGPWVPVEGSPFACTVKAGEKKQRPTSISGEDRSAMKKNDAAAATELLAMEAGP